MEGFGLDGVGSTVRRKRSNTNRRPRPDSQSFLGNLELSPPSSTPASENVSKVSSDENAGIATSSRREFNLNQCASRASSVGHVQGDTSLKKFRKDDGSSGGHSGFRSSGLYRGIGEQGRGGSDAKRSSEGALAPANWKSMSKLTEKSDSQLKKSDKHVISRKNDDVQKAGHSGVVSEGLGNENKLRKVKLKVGGVTRTIHAKASSDSTSHGGSSMKSSRLSDISRPRPKLILQENSDDDPSPPPSGKTSVVEGAPWKDSSRENHSSLGKKDEFSRNKMPEGSGSGKQADKFEPVRKSKRVPKRRFLDGEFSDGGEDEETRYLEKLKASKLSNGPEYDDDGYEGGKKKVSRISKIRTADGEYFEDAGYGSSRSGRDGKKRSRTEKETLDTDYMAEEELGSDAEPDSKGKKQRKESVESLMEGKKEMTLTTRQRALQSGKDTGTGASLIEFPNGLPPAPPRKQKEKLTEVEQQLKKAEAAQRRRMQVEKANRENEAEAIRKILGQDSSRKKKEDKIKKRLDERAQERAASATTLAPNTIRWVLGPTGTVVIFPDDVGLPSLFNSKPCSYPPPREKCAGPSCTNTYKYRDSKSKLPLCSLQCYKAVRDQVQPVSTC